MAHSTLEQAILEFVGGPDYRPLKPRAIAGRLRLPKGQLDELKTAVKRLIRRGELVYGANHLVQAAGGGGARAKAPVAAGAKGKQVVGVFQRTQKGFGFVRPQAERGAAAAPAGTDARAADIYIPRKYTGDAASGDVVLVEVHPGRAGQEGPRGRHRRGPPTPDPAVRRHLFPVRRRRLRGRRRHALRPADLRGRSRRQGRRGRRQGGLRDGPLPLAGA